MTTPQDPYGQPGGQGPPPDGGQYGGLPPAPPPPQQGMPGAMPPQQQGMPGAMPPQRQGMPGAMPPPPGGYEPVPQGHAGPRPKEVELSFRLWIAAIVVGVIGLIVTFAQFDSLREQALADAGEPDAAVSQADLETIVNVTLVAFVVIAFVFLVLEVLFVFKMRAGRNWARIVLAVLAGLAVVSTLFSLGSANALTLIISLIQVLLIVGATIMMFLSGAKPWFERRPVY